MFNLLVGQFDNSLSADRLFEYTDAQVRDWVAPASGPADFNRLMSFPAVVTPELGFGEPAYARVGHFEGLRQVGRRLEFRFVPNVDVPAISTERIQAVRDRFGVEPFEFTRTHWAVKDVDLYKALWSLEAEPVPTPRAFKLPYDVPREHDLVAVMMPFDAAFDATYHAFGEAAAAAGFRCQRADDIWVNDHIMDDVLSLIWRAQVVIADLTGRNSNVFYEAGIAHTLGRDVILTSQSIDDVPFDLRSIRTLRYLANTQGLAQLTSQVKDRLVDLSKRPSP